MSEFFPYPLTVYFLLGVVSRVRQSIYFTKVSSQIKTEVLEDHGLFNFYFEKVCSKMKRKEVEGTTV